MVHKIFNFHEHVLWLGPGRLGGHAQLANAMRHSLRRAIRVHFGCDSKSSLGCPNPIHCAVNNYFGDLLHGPPGTIYLLSGPTLLLQYWIGDKLIWMGVEWILIIILFQLLF